MCEKACVLKFKIKAAAAVCFLLPLPVNDNLTQRKQDFLVRYENYVRAEGSYYGVRTK